jgi:PAS domain S-box-containing protein
MSVDRSLAPRDSRAISVASLPIDFSAWLDAWQDEFVFFRVDAADLIEYICPSVEGLLGFHPDELTGRDYREVFNSEHPLCVRRREATEASLLAESPDAVECVACGPNGRNVYLLLREREVADSRGACCGKEIMVQDISRRVEAELRLRVNERKYRRLLEEFRGDYIIYTRDARGVITYVSPSIESVLGIPRDRVLGRNWREVFDVGQPKLDAPMQVRPLDEQGNELRQMVVDMPHRDGGMRTLEIQEWSIFGFNGRCLGKEGIAKDVTLARRAEQEVRYLKEDLERRVALRTEQLSRINEELRASEARYRNVVEAQTEFIVRWRPDGTRTFVNEAYCRYFGRDPAECVGSGFMALVHPDDRAKFNEELAKLTPDNPLRSGEHRAIMPDGSTAWNHWTDRAIFDAEGRVVEYQSVGRDVTALKRSADLLRQKEDHLAHLSRLATMGEMVAGIAHELGQPLHAAKTFAEAARRHLESNRLDAAVRAVECTHEISRAVVRTVEIIHRLRDFTKSRPVRIERVDLNNVVRGAIEMMAYELRRVGATFQLDLSPDLPRVDGDHIQLEQLCVNLLKNACDAMESSPRGDRRLLIVTSATDGRVRLAIKDSGCGVAPEIQSRVFDAFVSTKPDGMGMGLSLCKSIADAHGMQIGFSANEDGRGVTFHVTLPAAEPT